MTPARTAAAAADYLVHDAHNLLVTIIICYFNYLLLLQHKARHPHEPPQRPQIITIITQFYYGCIPIVAQGAAPARTAAATANYRHH